MNHWHPLRLVSPVIVVAFLALAGVILAGNPDDGLLEPSSTDYPSATATALGSGFSFQGQLADEAGTPLSGQCDLRFGLFDDATDGSKLGELTRNGVPIIGGVFAVNLKFDPQLFSGGARWLQIAVRCPAGAGAFKTLTERHELSAVPYALSLRPGARVNGSVDAGLTYEAGLKVTNTSTNYPIGLYGEVSASSGPAIGVAGNNSSKQGYAIYGFSSPEGTGVRGEAVKNAGVWGSSVDWIGTYGYSDNYVGVMGESPNSGGVYGKSTEGRGVTGESVNEHGVYGISSNGSGVSGVSTAWIGVYGKSTNQTGVIGESSNFDGIHGVTTAQNRIGVKGVASAAGSVGVWGESAVSTGVYGQTGVANAAALWGRNTADGVALKVEGNAVQSLDMNGLPKAMVYVEGRRGIVRCFNGVNGSTTDGCGFSARWIWQGNDGDNSISVVDFGFPVEGRYIVASQQKDIGIDQDQTFWIRSSTGSQVTLQNWYCSAWHIDGCTVDPMDFTIIVY